jgi:poly(3-hydroxybutyrate) depolymerase
MDASDARVCEAHGLRYDGSLSSGCALCSRRTRAASEKAASRRLTRGALLGSCALIAGLGGVGILRMHAPSFPWFGSDHAASGIQAQAEARTVTLRTTNSSGRSGTYYIPRSRAAHVPLLVFFHGTGGVGADGIAAFRSLADQDGFAILAPDSRVSPSGELTWQVGDHPGDVTDDRRHVMSCLQEMLVGEHLAIDPAHVLAVGHSGGGSSAPYLATNEEPFTAFAVLHGGAFPGGFGARRMAGWFSTGSADPIRPPPTVQSAADATRAAGFDVSIRVFPGGHGLGEDERAAVVKWWLGR